MKAALYEAEQKIAGLTARVNKDYTDSSKSSSQSPSHKAIPNGREKSGRNPGGQKGHVHHERRRMEPTQAVAIPVPSMYKDDPNFKETGSTVRKQLVKLHVGVEVIEYSTSEFRNQTTGQRVHADFKFGRMNGSQSAVMICAAGDTVLYQGRPKKGEEGVAGSPLEFYEGILVSDHEVALIKHGSKNQECMAHIKRYVISSIENEKGFTWNAMMKEWIKDALSYWNEVHDGGKSIRIRAAL